MASILKIDVLEQRYANSGIYLSGRIRGDQGDIINNGRLVLPGNFEANTFNVVGSLAANAVNANTIYLGGINGKLEFDTNTSTLKINNASLALKNNYIAAETIYAGNNVSLNDDGTISISKDRWANTQYSLSNTAITIDNPNAYGTSDSDFFGWKVDQSSRHIITGANLEDEAGGTSSGKAYIFDIKTRQLICTLNNPNAVSSVTGDNFGREVAITEDYAVVSAYLEEHYANFVTSSSSGVVYVFNLASTLTQNSTSTATYTITNPNVYGGRSSDYFGSAVAASSKYIIVGAYAEDSAAGNSSGAAYIFDITDGSLLYTLTNPALDTTSAGDNFGYSVAITDTHAVVSAYLEDEPGGIYNSGKIYVYKISSLASSGIINTPSYVLDNPNAYDTPAYDLFGRQFDITDTHLAVGAYSEEDAGGSNSGKAYIFDVITGTLLHTLDNPNAYDTAVSDYFGHSVNLSSRHVIVGAPQEDDSGGTNSGKAYVFDLFTGALLQTLDNPNAFSTSASDDFAYFGLSISENYIVVGAHGELDENVNGGTNSGKVYVYENDYNLDKWIGIANQNIEVGTYGVVNIQGSIDNNQSGLTANENYYLGANGALSTVKTNIGVGKALDANTIQLFSLTESDETPLYLRDLLDVKTTATANQVLTADGVGGFYFANTTSSDAATSLAELTDVNSTATANQVLTAFGNGSFYFANAATSLSELTDIDFTTVPNGSFLSTDGAGNYYFANAAASLSELTDVNSTASNNQVLTADGTGGFYFADTATSLAELSDVNATATSNQVLTADGIGGFSFQSPTKYIGDNQKEYVANESILAGNTVGLRNDNKIESIYFETVNYPTSVGTTNTFTSGIVNPLSSSFDSNINKNIIAYSASGGVGHRVLVASPTVDNQISYGTPVQFSGSATYAIDLVFDSNANKTVMIYQSGTAGYASVITAYDSNNSVTFGAGSIFAANAGPVSGAFDSNSNKILIAYRNPSSGLNTGDAIVGTVSGSTISYGTANTFTTNAITRVSTTFDSNSNKVVISYNDSTDGNKPKAIVATINGTDVSFGEPVNYDTVNASAEDSTFDPISGKVIIAYRNASQAALIYTVVGTVTGDTITFGSPQRVTTTAPYFYGDYVSIDYNSNLNKIIIAGKGNTNQGLVISGTVSGNSIVFDTPAIDFSGTNVANYLTVSHNSNVNRTIISYYDASTTGGKSAVFNSYYSEDITNVDTWIGIANENISNTATGTVNLPGAIDKNQSGLIKDQTYYLNANGTLSTIKTNYSLVGKALDSNSIQIFAETSLSKLVDVNSTASNNQVLTADGTGGFYFANTAVEISTLTDIGIADGEADQVLTTDGNGSFSFGNIKLQRLTRTEHTANSSNFYNGEITAVTTANGICTGEVRVHNENFLGGVPVGNMALTQTVLEGGRISHLREARTIVDLGTINTRDLILQKGTDQLVIPANNVGIFKSDELTPIVEETNTKVTIKNVSIDLSNDTGAIIVPKGTTAQRPSSPVAGMIRYNTTLQQYEIYNESVVPATWSKIGDLPPEVTSVSPQFPDFGSSTTSFVISGNNFDQGSTVVFIGNDSSVITPLTVTFNTTTQLTAVANTFQFDFTKEPYDLKITKSGGLTTIYENAIYVDTKPTWSLTDSTTLTTVYGIYRDQGVEVTLPTSTDPDGDTVTYGAVNLPTGLSIDSTTGVISGLTESVTEYTTSNFTVQAKSTSGDAQNLGEQITSRTVNIVRTPEVLNSLRFDGSSYLSRTPSVSGNNTTFTYSLWVKRGNFTPSNQQMLFEAKLDGNDYFVLFLQTDDKANLHSYHTSKTGELITTQVFRDASAWYNFLFKVDTTLSTANDRYQLYINGSRITELDTNTQPTQSYNTYTNTTNQHRIGAGQAAGQTFYGYLADIHFIDGQALGPNNFGQTVDGMWVPKQYSGSGYGVNGFHLDFSPDNLVFNGNTLQTVKDIAPIDGTHTTANDWAAN